MVSLDQSSDGSTSVLRRWSAFKVANYNASRASKNKCTLRDGEIIGDGLVEGRACKIHGDKREYDKRAVRSVVTKIDFS